MKYKQVLDLLLGSLKNTVGEEQVKAIVDNTRPYVKRAIQKEMLVQTIVQLSLWQRVALLIRFPWVIPSYVFRERPQ